MAFFYVGQCAGQRNKAKIGQTGRKYISDRMHELRKQGNELTQVRYMHIEGNGIVAEHIEAEVRYNLDRDGKYQSVQHDHFILTAEDSSYKDFLADAIYYAVRCCEREGIHYVIKG